MIVVSVLAVAGRCSEDAVGRALAAALLDEEPVQVHRTGRKGKARKL